MPKRVKPDLHILVRDLPREVDNVINTIAVLTARRKWEVVREALVEYANNHKKEITASE